MQQSPVTQQASVSQQATDSQKTTSATHSQRSKTKHVVRRASIAALVALSLVLTSTAVWAPDQGDATSIRNALRDLGADGGLMTAVLIAFGMAADGNRDYAACAEIKFQVERDNDAFTTYEAYIQHPYLGVLCARFPELRDNAV